MNNNLPKYKKIIRLVALMAQLSVFSSCRDGWDTVRLTVISTNDFHGQLEGNGSSSPVGPMPLGGFDWILGYFRAVREENPGGVILLDGGDLWQGTMISNLTKGQAVIDLYNTAGYDAVALGNHEFDFGPGEQGGGDLRYVLKERLKEAKFPMLAANVATIEDQRPLVMPNFSPYTIITRKGVKIGIIGLATPSTRQTTAPKNVIDLTFTDCASAVARYSRQLRAAGATVVILLTHMGANWDSNSSSWQGELVDLLREIGSDVDLVIGAHTHTIISERIEGVPVISAGYYGRSFTRADILIDRSWGQSAIAATELFGPTFFFHKSTSEAPPTYRGRVIRPDHSFDKAFEKYQALVKKVQDIPYGSSARKISNIGQYDTAVGRLATDALLAALPAAQVAVLNRGSMRNSLPHGQITFGDIYKVIPFDNEAVMVKISGRQLLAVLDHGLRSQYGVPEISGLTVYLDPTASPERQIVKVIMADGSQLDPQAFYTVVSNDFVYGGGDGYTMFANGEAENTHLAVRDILADYIKNNSPLNLPAKKRYIIMNMTASGSNPEASSEE